MISLIACMDEQQGIGIQNQLPWHLPEDLQYFKETTIGKVVVMGRKTFESIGKPLPNRTNVILTKEPTFCASENCLLYNSIEDFLKSEWNQEAEVFIIGGASIYKQFLPYADRLYLTKVEGTFPCDAFFPKINWEMWREIDKKEGKLSEPFPYHFYVYERKASHR